MGKTLSEFFETTDVVEDCRVAVQEGSLRNFRSRIKAEIILKDGSRRYFRCRSLDRDFALNEVLTFVKAIESATNDKVLWRFKGDTTYHMGSELPVSISKSKSIKEKFKRFLDYFFDLED